MMKFKGTRHNKKPNPCYIKSLAITGLTIASLITGINCGKSNPTTPTPPDMPLKTYNITLEAKAITEGFPNLAGAQITLKGTTSSQITTINSGETIPYNAKDRGYMTEINTTGGHNQVLCIRTPNGTKNLRQKQNRVPAIIDLPNVPIDGRKGENIHLVLYKIPTSTPINKVKEALSRGTAVYDHAVTFYPVNDGYPEEDFNIYKKTMVKSKSDNILNQINTIYGVPGCNYDPNKTSGNQKIRLGPQYMNPTHGESGSGVMTWSDITIMHNMPVEYFLEELYQAMGVRHDIGSSISDDVANNTGTLNQFRRNLMLINYFLDPSTKLN